MTHSDHNQADPDSTTNGHPIFAAVYDFTSRWREEDFMPEHRQYLAQGIHGTVLDVGVGTGDMFPYFVEAAQRDSDLHFHGIEPDPYMLSRAEINAEELGLSIDLQAAQAESLPYDDERFDVVIASIVFCTIADRDRALEEIHRVLQPSGEFRFFEHVRSEGTLGRVQDVMTPVWKRLSAGCHLNYRTRQVIERSPLDIAEIETLDGQFPENTLIRGTATR
jgi:ubiquinone/menaquinone biosynthesis C-methylase UbiE